MQNVRIIFSLDCLGRDLGRDKSEDCSQMMEFSIPIFSIFLIEDETKQNFHKLTKSSKLTQNTKILIPSSQAAKYFRKFTSNSNSNSPKQINRENEKTKRMF
jgi:hypothetical protein